MFDWLTIPRSLLLGHADPTEPGPLRVGSVELEAHRGDVAEDHRPIRVQQIGGLNTEVLPEVVHRLRQEVHRPEKVRPPAPRFEFRIPSDGARRAPSLRFPPVPAESALGEGARHDVVIARALVAGNVFLLRVAATLLGDVEGEQAGKGDNRRTVPRRTDHANAPPGTAAFRGPRPGG